MAVVEVVNKVIASNQSDLRTASLQHHDPWILVNSFPKMAEGSLFRVLGDRGSRGC